jgi:hypothetical protein
MNPASAADFPEAVAFERDQQKRVPVLRPVALNC